MRKMLLTTLVATAALGLAATAADAKSCFTKAAVGAALTEGLAQFQVDAALLQATDWNIYFTYISTGTTPGYTFGKRTYQCKPGAVAGFECKGQAQLCKL
jgi:hypothetical protein